MIEGIIVVATKNNKRKRKGWWWKIPLGLLLLLLIGLAVVLLNIDSIARTQINKALDHYLVAGGNLEAIDIGLMTGRVELTGLTINSPPNFGKQPLVTLDALAVDVVPLAVFSGKIVVEHVGLKGLSLNIVRDKQGDLSLMQLIPEASPAPDALPADDKGALDPLWIPIVHINSIAVDELFFHLTDQLIGEQWSVAMHLDLIVEGLKLNDLVRRDILVNSVKLSLGDIVVDPLPGFSEDQLLAINNVQIVSSDINLGTSQVSVSEVTVDTLSASLERNAEREVNLLKVVESWMPVTEGDHGEKSDSSALASTVHSSMSIFELPTLIVENIQLKSVTAQVLDSIEGQPWRAGFDGLDLQVTGVAVGDLAQQAISLASFDLDLKGISVDQPPGFSQEPLLAISNIALTSKGIDLGNSEVTVSDIMLDTLSVSLERNADREINLLKVVESWLPSVAEDKDGESDPAASSAPADPFIPPFKLPTLIVENIQLKSITAQVLDSIEGQPWRAGFDGLDLQVAGVAVGDLTRQAISLASFDLDLKGIAVDQPPGFGTRKLFSLDHFTVVSEKPEAASKELVIKQVSLEGLSAFITMRSDGLTNLEKLNEALRGHHAETRQNKEDIAVETTASTPKGIMPPVLFEQISMAGGPVMYRDEVFADEPLEATLKDIRMEVNGLRLFTDNPDVDPASASVFLELEQPGDLPTAYFGTLANVGPVGNGVPMVNSQVRLVGFKLDTLGSLVTPSTRTALGATGLDAGMAMAMDSDSINLRASVLTDRDVTYKGISVQGPLNAPVVKPGPVLAGVFSRVSDGLVNLGKSGLKSGVDIVEGGVDVGKELGSGAIKVGVNLGKSLFETTVGVVTLDKEKVKEGTSGTTKGTIDLTGESVKGSGQAAGGSLKSSASELKGKERVRAWDQDIPNRYQKFMQHAREALAEMPYPPVTK